MAEAATGTWRAAEGSTAAADTWRAEAVLEPLPCDFLRLSLDQVSADEQLAQSLMAQQQLGAPVWQSDPNIVGVLRITVDRAELVKNYGFTRMDPYCRLTIGTRVYETNTCYKSGTRPVWNKVIQCLVHKLDTRITIEIFDECQFQQDSRIAWALMPLDDRILQAEKGLALAQELSGEQGEDKEGVIYLQINPVRRRKPHPQPSHTSNSAPAADDVQLLDPSASAETGETTGDESSPEEPYSPPEEQVQSLAEMFPTVDIQAVRSVLEATNGDMELSINSLLQISQPAAGDPQSQQSQP